MSTNYRVEFGFKRGDGADIDEKEAEVLKDILGLNCVTVEDGSDMGDYRTWWGNINLCGGASCSGIHNDICNDLPDCYLAHSDWWYNERPPDESFSSDGWDDDDPGTQQEEVMT